MEAENRRGGFKMPVPGLGGGKVTVAYRMRHAAELGLFAGSRDGVRLHHPGGIPVPSGTWIPRARPTPRGENRADRLRAANLVPFLKGAFAVQVDNADGHFMVGENRVTVDQLAESIRRASPSWSPSRRRARRRKAAASGAAAAGEPERPRHPDLRPGPG